MLIHPKNWHRVPLRTQIKIRGCLYIYSIYIYAMRFILSCTIEPIIIKGKINKSKLLISLYYFELILFLSLGSSNSQDSNWSAEVMR